MRISGPGALAMAGLLVRAAHPLTSFPSHALRRVTIIDSRTGAPLDEAMCAVMRGPRSYTGEDVVELSCHGSPALLALIVDRLREAGARVAEPGEFTRRAFLNGRLDLAQAEAVALAISARTERAVRLSARAMAGELSSRIGALREQLLDLIAGLEVALDFPEEQIGVDLDEARKTVLSLRHDVEGLIGAASAGRLVSAGITVAVVGAPNAGKSSLYNAIVGKDRTIVSPEAGTTRDVVEATVLLAGIEVRLLDTAGIGPARDAVDAEGIRRSRIAIEESDLLLVVLDRSALPERAILAETANRPRVVVFAKGDLLPHPEWVHESEGVVASTRAAPGVQPVIARLRAEIEHVSGGAGDETAILASLRQLEALASVRAALETGALSLDSSPVEVSLIDLRSALDGLDSLVGRRFDDALLERIFSRFCIGK